MQLLVYASSAVQLTHAAAMEPLAGTLFAVCMLSEQMHAKFGGTSYGHQLWLMTGLLKHRPSQAEGAALRQDSRSAGTATFQLTFKEQAARTSMAAKHEAMSLQCVHVKLR